MNAKRTPEPSPELSLEVSCNTARYPTPSQRQTNPKPTPKVTKKCRETPRDTQHQINTKLIPEQRQK